MQQKCPHDVQFSCAINQPLLAHHWWVHQCLLTSRFIAPSIPWGISPLVARCGSRFSRTVTFLIIHQFLPLKVLLLYICFSKSTAYNTFQFEKLFWIWWKVLDTIILWQDVGLCCEQTHATFEVGLSPDQGQGVYSGWSDVVVNSQLHLCHTCIIDVMSHQSINGMIYWFQTIYCKSLCHKHDDQHIDYELNDWCYVE